MKLEKVFAWTIGGALLLCLLIVQTLRWFSLDPLPQSNTKDDRREAQPQQPTPLLPVRESVYNPQSNLAALPFDEASEPTETPEMPTQTEDSEVDPSGVVGGVVPNEEPVIDLKAAGVIPDDQLPPLDDEAETALTPEMPTQTEDSEVDPSGVVGGVVPNEEPVIDLEAAGVVPDDQLPLLDDEAEAALQREAAEQEAAMRAAMEDGNIDPSGLTDGAIPQDFSVPDSGATGVGAQ